MNNQLELFFKFYKDDDKENQGFDLFDSLDDNLDDFGFSELEETKPKETKPTETKPEETKPEETKLEEEKPVTPTASIEKKEESNVQETSEVDEKEKRREERRKRREEEKLKKEAEKAKEETVIKKEEEVKEETVIKKEEEVKEETVIKNEEEDYNAYVGEEVGENEDEGNNKMWIFLLIFLFAILLGGGYFGYQYLYSEEEPLPALPEIDTLAFSPEPEPEPEETPEETPEEGTITEIRERSGKAYVVVSSSIDGDLAMDSAKELTKQGYQCYIIYPFNFRGRKLSYRVAVAAFDSVVEASNNLDKYRDEVVPDAWVINY